MNARRIIPALLLMCALASASCTGSRTLVMKGSPEVPAAEGNVVVSATDNGNTKLDLTVEHLAAPERVNPTATVYVVWIRGKEAGLEAQNMGALKVDDKLKGGLKVVTPLRAFDLFITAEPSQAETQPTGSELLYTTVAWK